MLLREATVSYSGKRIEGSAQVASAADVYRICRGELLGVRVLDHVVIGDGEFVSLAETATELFS